MKKRIFWLAACLLLLKLLLLPFAQTTDADAVTRTFLSEDWLAHPIWIINTVWGPFHFYLTAFVLTIWHNQINAPIVLNIILSSLMLLPFYYLVKREVNENGAFVASCFLAISPIIFRNSLMNMSETPYLFLITITLNLISKGLHNKRPLDFILAGLAVTLASGFRFEAWVFIGLLFFIIILKKEWMNATLFLIVAMLYPGTDMVTNFISDHYSFSSFFNNYPWNMHPDCNFGTPHFQDYLRRIWFIPFCWVISMGPAAFLALKEIVLSRKRNPNLFWLAFLFWAFLLLLEYSAFKGGLILHERFAATITLISLPFSAFFFKELPTKKIRMALLFAVLTIGLTFVYNMENITPLPRLTSKEGTKTERAIEKTINPQSGLIIDFWDWESTYYIALESKLPTHSIYLVDGNHQDAIQADKINDLIKAHPQGVILLVKNSLLWQNALFNGDHIRFKFSATDLDYQELVTTNEITVLKYTTK